MMDERRLQKGQNEERYNTLNRTIHRECTKAKEKWMNEKCKEIEDLDKRDQQLMYERVKEITYKNKNRSNTSTAIKQADGTVVMEEEEVIERWAEYIAELFHDNRIEQLELNNNGKAPQSTGQR